ncbi:MAG TPA: cobalamin-independent methionine synthase II family protein [Chloroflexota bacterium]|nr:cobalamin-independent methionine synthase II family protein [Chloroflexota bacterium]
MKHSTTRILTTHAGSLIRPEELLALKPDDPAYGDVLRRSVAEVVKRQAEAGVDVVSDGEFGKSGFHIYTSERLSGIETVDGPSGGIMPGEDARRFEDFYRKNIPGDVRKRIVTGPIQYTGHAAIQQDLANLKAALAVVQVEEAFLPVIAPSSVLSARAWNDDIDQHYPTAEAFLYGLADALSVEYRTIAESGLLVQIDDPSLPLGWDRMLPNITVEDFRTWCELRVEVLNHALRGIPRDRVRYHICWGSWNAPHTTDVELKHIADVILRINAGAFSIEAANPRHEHEWRVWETVKLPDEAVLIPGVVTHSTNVVEHPELVAERIVRFARLVGRERVIAGTDCGFAQIAGYQRVHPTIMWAKLETLAQGAKLASSELF